MKGPNEKMKSLLVKCLNKEQAEVLKSIVPVDAFLFDVESFLTNPSDINELILTTLAKSRRLSKDTINMIKAANLFIPKSYFKAILINWLLLNSEINGKWNLKYRVTKNLNLNSSEEFAANMMNEYINHKVNAYLRKTEAKVDNCFDELFEEIRGKWLAENIELKKELKEARNTIYELRKIITYNKQIKHCLTLFKRELSKIKNKVLNLAKYCFRSRKGKAIGLANIAIKTIENSYNKYDILYINKMIETIDDKYANQMVAYDIILESARYRKYWDKLNNENQCKLINSLTVNLDEWSKTEDTEKLIKSRIEKISEKKQEFLNIEYQDELFERIYENDDYLCGYITEEIVKDGKSEVSYPFDPNIWSNYNDSNSINTDSQK